MSYMTSYYLSATRAGVDVTEAILPSLITKTGMDARHFDGDKEAKWFDSDEDMQAISVQFPDVVFRLHGVGESASDVWVNWYRGGSVQRWHLDVDLPDGPPLPWSGAA